jgi:cystathionine beta-lyase
VRLARIYRVSIISDEIHAPLVLPGRHVHPAAGRARRGRRRRSVLSASKASNLAGLKCAAVVTASPLMAAVVDRFPPDTGGASATSASSLLLRRTPTARRGSTSCW